MQKWVGTILATVFLMLLASAPVMIMQNHNQANPSRATFSQLARHHHFTGTTKSSNTTTNYHASVGD